MKPINKQQGMTLLEVLVALVIFSIGCLALIKTTGSQVRNLGAIEASNMALWVADNQLSRLQLEAVPTLNWQQGMTEMAAEEWHWRYRGRETTDNAMLAIEIEVRRGSAQGPLITSLMAYRERER